MQAQSNGATAVKPPPVDVLTYEGVEVSVETIEPPRAAALLQANDGNRNLRQKQADVIREALETGDWRFNGEAIRIDRDGKLLDGQHRLKACVDADLPIVAVVVKGLEPDVQQTIDIGAKRTVADTLKMRGETNPNVVGGALVLLNCWMRWGVLNRGSSRGLAFTPQTALRLLDTYPEFTSHARLGTRNAFKALASPTVWTVASFLLHRIDETDALVFFESVAAGAGLDAGDPRYTLRERLLNSRNLAATTVSQSARAWMILRAWTAFQAREELRHLRPPHSLSPASAWPDVPGDTLRFSTAKDGDLRA